MENQTYDIYYDKEGDFLEITFGAPPKGGCADEVEEGIFVTKNEDTGEVYGVGIMSFKKRVDALGRILKKLNIELPLEITVPVGK